MNALNNFSPSLPVYFAIAAGISVTLFLIIYSHRPCKISLGKRFIISSISGLALWIILCVLIFKNHPATDIVSEIISGLFLFIAIVLATWFIWSLLAYSFRFNILLTLDEKNKGMTIDDLIVAYSNGQGLQPVMQGRLTLLKKLNMIEEDEENIILTDKNGKIITFWMMLIMKFWGLKKSI